MVRDESRFRIVAARPTIWYGIGGDRAISRSTNVERRLITGRVFGDLALWMVGFGLLVGVIFPFAIIVLGPPVRMTLRVAFFAGTVTAGLIVGLVNCLLARRVVGSRLRELAARMSYVGSVITESTDTGDWSRCTPDECELVVDSADELGDAARSFNELLHALAQSRRFEQAMSGLSSVLVQHLEVDDVAEAAPAGFLEHSGADAGALGVVRDGVLVVAAAHRVDATVIESSTAVRAALLDINATVIDVPEGLVTDVSPPNSPRYKAYKAYKA